MINDQELVDPQDWASELISRVERSQETPEGQIEELRDMILAYKANLEQDPKDWVNAVVNELEAHIRLLEKS